MGWRKLSGEPVHGVTPAGSDEEPWHVQRSRLQRQLEARELKRANRPWMPRLVVGLAVSTLALGLAVLGLVTQLDLNEVEDVPPQVAFASDSASGEVQVLKTEEDLRWSDLQIQGSCTPLLNGHPLLESPAAQVQPGDVLSCDSGETLQIHSTRERGDAILHETRFG